MELNLAVSRLTALAQETRLGVFRALVQAGPQGLSAGTIAERVGIAPNTLSFHLKELSHAGLIRARKEGRFLYYAPDIAAMNALLAYLTENCCAETGIVTECTAPASCLQEPIE